MDSGPPRLSSTERERVLKRHSVQAGELGRSRSGSGGRSSEPREADAPVARTLQELWRPFYERVVKPKGASGAAGNDANDSEGSGSSNTGKSGKRTGGSPSASGTTHGAPPQVPPRLHVASRRSAQAAFGVGSAAPAVPLVSVDDGLSTDSSDVTDNTSDLGSTTSDGSISSISTLDTDVSLDTSGPPIGARRSDRTASTSTLKPQRFPRRSSGSVSGTGGDLFVRPADRLSPMAAATAAPGASAAAASGGDSPVQVQKRNVKFDGDGSESEHSVQERSVKARRGFNKEMEQLEDNIRKENQAAARARLRKDKLARSGSDRLRNAAPFRRRSRSRSTSGGRSPGGALSPSLLSPVTSADNSAAPTPGPPSPVSSTTRTASRDAGSGVGADGAPVDLAAAAAAAAAATDGNGAAPPVPALRQREQETDEEFRARVAAHGFHFADYHRLGFSKYYVFEEGQGIETMPDFAYEQDHDDKADDY